MIRCVPADVARLVPSIFGTASEGNLSIDLQEAAQVFSMRDAMVRSMAQRRQFIRAQAHAIAGALETEADLWTAGDWTAIGGAAGASLGAVPEDHDAFILGASIAGNGGATGITIAIISALFPLLTSGDRGRSILVSGVAGPSGAINFLELTSVLPFPLARADRSELAFTGVVTASSTVTYTLDVLSAPIGVIPFA